MARKLKMNYSDMKRVNNEVIFTKQVEYNKQLLELTIKVNPNKYKRINYSYQASIPETQEI